VMLSDPIFQGLAIALMAGEVASLLLSRMTVPVLYFLSERRRQHRMPVEPVEPEGEPGPIPEPELPVDSSGASDPIPEPRPPADPEGGPRPSPAPGGLGELEGERTEQPRGARADSTRPNRSPAPPPGTAGQDVESQGEDSLDPNGRSRGRAALAQGKPD
jgi:hypothetical protein